jgi:predicted RND superfamily exporter protein
MYEFALAEDEIALGQVRGLAAALATIFLIMRAIFRSTRLAAVAMLPNVLPLIVAFGFLGYVRVPLDAGIVVSACMVLGIAVDNTLHMMTSFQNYRQAGWASEASLKAAFGHVLVPVVLSSVAIGLGFAVLGLSGFAFVRNLGLLVVSVMGICLLADVLLLPALLLRYGQVRAKP